MKSKGFTLIELLAVIVILAIIALIATPIILNIIEDAKSESAERSAENYLEAVELAVAKENLNGEFNPTSCDIQANGYIKCGDYEPIKIEVDGEVPEVLEGSVITFSKGEIIGGNFKISGTNFVIEDGKLEIGSTAQTQLTRYYSCGFGTVNEELPIDAKLTVEELDPSYPYYIGLDVDSDKIVKNAYVCFKKQGIQYCLKSSNSDQDVYNENVIILEKAFNGIEDTCSDQSGFICSDDNLEASTFQFGNVKVVASDGFSYCEISFGSFGCEG